MSGSSGFLPECVAFISRASNLVPDDHNHCADALVEDLRTGRITRVSVTTRGREANGETTEVAVSGDCRRVALVSGATTLAQTTTPKRVEEARTQAPPNTSQVYMHFRAGGLRGVTMLVSAHGVRPADADVTGLTLSRNGTALAYATSADISACRRAA